MTGDARHENRTSPAPGGTLEKHVAQRLVELCADDEQIRAAMPKPDVVEAARRPGLRLPQVLQTYAEGYADRPALGWRARTLTTDPATGRTTSRLLPRFETITYCDLWDNVRAAAAAWRHDPEHPLAPGDFVATVGFASPDYLAIESALGSQSVRRIVVFDYLPEIDDQRESLDRATAQLKNAGLPAIVETLEDVIARGRSLPTEPVYTDGDDQRLAMIMYTSGSTGLPKGAMYTENMVSRIWTSDVMPTTEAPVVNVNFMPMNHLGGRIPLGTSFQAGGTSFFVPESDLST